MQQITRISLNKGLLGYISVRFNAGDANVAGDFSPVNKTEQLAYNWLISQGFSSDNIKFQPLDSPDFLTNNGSFEVKRVDHKRIYCTKRQINALENSSNLSILLFSKDSKSPLMLSYADMKRNYTIVVEREGYIHRSLTVESSIWSKWLKFCVDKTGSAKSSSEMAEKAFIEYMETHP